MTKIPINKIKRQEIYIDVYKRNKNKINSIFLFIIKKIQYVKINQLKKRLMIKKKKNNILNNDIYIIQYKNINKFIYKIYIKQNIIKLKNTYFFTLKVIKNYILLNKYS